MILNKILSRVTIKIFIVTAASLSLQACSDKVVSQSFLGCYSNNLMMLEIRDDGAYFDGKKIANWNFEENDSLTYVEFLPAIILKSDGTSISIDNTSPSSFSPVRKINKQITLQINEQDSDEFNGLFVKTECVS